MNDFANFRLDNVPKRNLILPIYFCRPRGSITSYLLAYYNVCFKTAKLSIVYPKFLQPGAIRCSNRLCFSKGHLIELRLQNLLLRPRLLKPIREKMYDRLINFYNVSLILISLLFGGIIFPLLCSQNRMTSMCGVKNKE